MARLKNIPPNLYDSIADESAKGKSCREIVEWLQQEHKIKSPVPSISRLLREVKDERQEIAKRAYANAVAKSANQDIFILGDVISKCKQRFDALIETKDDFKAKSIADVMIKSNNDDQLKEDILKKLSEFDT